MSLFHVTDPRGEHTTPPPQGSSPGGDTWSNQVTVQQHHAFPLGQATSTWHSFDLYSTNISDARTMQYTLPGDDNSPSIEQYSQYGEPGSDDSSNTSYSGSGSIDPRLTQRGSPSQYPQQIGLTGMPPVASPGQLTTAASSPAPLHYQNASPAQATRYTTDSTDNYFFPNPNYPQPSARQRQESASSPQGWGHHPNQNMNNFVLSPRLPYQPAHPPDDIEADHSGPGPYVCDVGVCRATFRRPTDLERHRKTSKKHNKVPRGPACPFNPCSYPSRFTRADNFKAHYMKQHGASNDEADEFIREWKERGMPKEPW